MEDKIDAIRARHQNMQGVRGAIWSSEMGHIAHNDRATLLAYVDRLDAERKALRALCLEAAEFYGYGGTFPMRGVMAMRLTGAALGTLAAALAKDATTETKP